MTVVANAEFAQSYMAQPQIAFLFWLFPALMESLSIG